MAMSTSGWVSLSLTVSDALLLGPGPGVHEAEGIVAWWGGHLEETTQTQGLPALRSLAQGSILPTLRETT